MSQLTTPWTSSPVAGRGLWRALSRKLRSDPVAIACVGLLSVVVLASVFADLIYPADPNKTSMIMRLRPPGTPGFPLGTDELGRDMLARLLHGGRYSLFMGIVPVLFAMVLGGLIGISAGYAGGRINSAVMRTLDVFFAFPSILFAVAISGSLGPGIVNSLITLTLVFIPPIARVAEASTVAIASLDYVCAARITGAGAWQILSVHVLRNVAGPVLIFASSLISISIVIASGLSFLGLGATPPTPEWGMMLSSLRQVIYVAPATAILPGVLIFVTSVAFNMLSDAFRAALDYRR